MNKNNVKMEKLMISTDRQMEKINFNENCLKVAFYYIFHFIQISCVKIPILYVICYFFKSLYTSN